MSAITHHPEHGTAGAENSSLSPQFHVAHHFDTAD